MTNWKENIQLMDLDGAVRIEVTCKTCSYSWYECVQKLLLIKLNRFAYLDEVEDRLRCKARGCKGKTRIALSSEAETDGFLGGLA